MPLQIDAYNKLVKFTSPTTEVNAQELHDFIEDYMASPVGTANDSGDSTFLGDILIPEGKIEDPNNPGVYSQIILKLNSEWQYQFWGGSGYTRLYGGKFVGGVSNQPIKATGTAGDITVMESPVDGFVVESSVSGLTAAESAILTGLDANLTYLRKIIDNYKELIKVGDSWYLYVYDDGEVSGGTTILEKKQVDKDGNDITDLVAGLLAAELENTV